MSRYPEADESGYGAPYQHPQSEPYGSPYQPPHLDAHGSPYAPQGSFSPPPPPPPGAGYNPAPSPYHPPTSPFQSSASSTLAPSFPAPGGHYSPGPVPSATPNPYDSYTTAAHPDDPFRTPYEQPFQLHTGIPIERHNTPLNPMYNQVPRPISTPAYENDELGPHGDVDENDIPLLQRDGAPSSFPGGFMPGGMPGDDADSTNNIHYGRIPQRIPRRYKTIKRVELFHGNFVVDCAVPKKLLDMCAMKDEREFTFMRYTAATCDPNDFREEKYSLRQVLYDPPRKTELFIVMTMYNEDEELFCRTMHGVMKNIAHLITRTRSKTWGADGWKKVVVCIVSDGRMKINARTLSVIAAMGIYQDGIGKNSVNTKDVTAHIYEYTTQVSVTPSLKIEGSERGVCPVQVIFCLKEKNQKKINSHRWFFNAFGPVLNPNVCVLLDVGTMPGPTSIYHLWKSFDINSNVGGACGEIVAMKGKYMQNLLNPLVAAQNFEYKMSNILDKPLESIFGYISVLPGAFSAYRYHALQNDATGQGPLQKYFLGEKMHGAGADIFTANMYLAEDRILCWELVSKRGGSWILHYVKSAYAVTDVPDQVPELISQRRRWLNGSFFAAIHSIVKFGYIYRSAHSPLRKFWIHIEMLYQVFNLIFSWFALGNYYIAFKILANAMEDPTFNFKGIHIANLILEYFYVGLLVLCFLLALGNRPQGSKWGYTGAIIGFAIITCYMTFSAFFLAFKGVENIEHSEGPLDVDDIFKNAIFRNIVISILATIGLYLISSLLFFEPWHMITSFLQYTLMAPSYINVLNVYAFANVHDVSWGTKGDNKPATDLGVVATGKNKNEVEAVVPTDEKDINAAYEDAIHVLGTKPPKAEQKVDAKTAEEDYYRTFRTNVLLAWTLSNGLLVAAVIAGTGDAASKQAKNTVNGYLAFVLFSVAGLAAFRFLGATAYMIVRLFAGE